MFPAISSGLKTVRKTVYNAFQSLSFPSRHKARVFTLTPTAMKKFLLLSGAMVTILVFSACKQKSPAAPVVYPPPAPEAPAAGILTFESATCNGLSPDELAPIVNIPAEELEPKVEAVDENKWVCSYGNQAVYFTVTVTQTTQECDDSLENYRQNEENLAKFLPQDQYPQGTHSDVKRPDFEGIRSEVTDSFNAHKCNISVFVTKPEDKMMQVKIVEAFFKEP